MRVLVTGGFGYVGSVVALRLVQAGHEVAVLTRGGRPTAGPPPAAVMLRGDLLDHDRVRELVARLRPEATCHLAGLVRVRDSFRDPAAYHAVNVGGTASLLRALSEHAERSGRAARLVFASAGAVYGPGGGGPVGEDAPCRPTSPYGASKLAAEELIAGYAASGAVGAVSLRCAVVAGAVGPYGDTDTSRLLPKALAVAGGLQATLVVNGDGSATREYTHVADVAEAYLLALGAARPGRHRAYNVGSGTSASIGEVVAAVERVTGRRLPVERRRAADEPHALALDSGRARRELGWRPVRSSLDGMVADAWRWLRGDGAAAGYRCAIGTGSTGSARSKPNTRL
jgi:UDP-glucose 4-epimerase